MKKLYQLKFLRKAIIPLIRLVNPGKIKITHHYTKLKFNLDFFKHKGYWYHGKRREQNTIKAFQKYISSNDVVIEVGGHIGYLSQIFSTLIGDNGTLYIFEPGSNNLEYLYDNTKMLKNVQIIEKAISESDDVIEFYEEGLTGQNNSIIKDYEVFNENKANANLKDTQIQVKKVNCTTIDKFVLASSIAPNFIKIDIEGAELLAINGMTKTLKELRPILMIEITLNHEKIINLLKSYNYVAFNDNGKQVDQIEEMEYNVFFIPKERKDLLNSIS